MKKSDKRVFPLRVNEVFKLWGETMAGVILYNEQIGYLGPPRDVALMLMEIIRDLNEWPYEEIKDFVEGKTGDKASDGYPYLIVFDFTGEDAAVHFYLAYSDKAAHLLFTEGLSTLEFIEVKEKNSITLEEEIDGYSRKHQSNG